MRLKSDFEIVFSVIICFNVFGSLILSLNSRLLKSKVGFLQYLCFLGYCNFTFCVSSLLNLVLGFFPVFLLLLIDIGAYAWAFLIMWRFLRIISEEQKLWLNAFPCFLFFSFLAVFQLISLA